MTDCIVCGGTPLYGDVCISGAKNSALPLLAGTLLTRATTVLHHCPNLSDVRATLEILKLFGCTVLRDGDTVVVNSRDAAPQSIPEHLMHEMRSSIIFLGAMLGRFGQAHLCMPGGCELGPRPIDWHLAALQKLGVTVQNEGDTVCCTVQSSLCGTAVTLPFPSVGATENLLLAAVTATGTTTVINAACEPEIVDLADFLNACGARIHNAGGATIVVHGVDCLHGCDYTVCPDRIEAATFLSAAALTGGHVTLNRVRPSDMTATLSVFEQMGCKLRAYPSRLTLKTDGRLLAAREVSTRPYPGFPTDAQAVLMAAATTAAGTSIFVENIFESRYKHVEGLTRMGADIRVIGKTAVVHGVKKLHGATVRCTDLRGGAALVIAALGAEGETRVTAMHHILRGYEQFTDKLNALGTKVKTSGSEKKTTDDLCRP